MKKILVVLALAAFASTASAMIENSAHDLSKRSGAALGSCAYCHAPHLKVVSNLTGTPPLWNRNSQAASAYTVWSSTYIPFESGPGTRSLTCLSCHDGQQDLGLVNNGPASTFGAGQTRINDANNIGTNLQNDHPVGITYANYFPTPEEILAGQVNELVNPPTNNVRLRSGKVECSSCHDPHGDGFPFFLRTSTALLCGSCHLK